MPRRSAAVLVIALLALSVSACTAATADRDDLARGGSGALSDDAVDVDTALDPWTDAFDDRAASIGESATGVAWGSFGPAGDTAAAGWTDASLPPGDHVVAIECDGAESVTVTLSPGEADAADDGGVVREVGCPGGASYPITTDVAGLSVTIDSHGQPGAYLAAVDPAP